MKSCENIGKTGSFCLMLCLIWTAVIAAITTTTLVVYHRNVISEAENEARDYFRLNYYYRAWSARLGGVYAPADKVEPNPYLTLPERDLVTTGGKRLTLVNPAYMTRMVFDDIKKSSGDPVVSKLTSLKPTNPVNAPDSWEREALHAFERGAKDQSQITKIDGKPYLRLISRFVTEKPCLKCHAQHGYKQNEVRGGISIAIPLNGYYEGEKQVRSYISAGYLFLWVLGCSGIVYSTRKREVYEQQLLANEEKFRTVCDWTQDWEYWADPSGKMMYVSPPCEQVTGYSAEEFMQDKNLVISLVHPDDRAVYEEHHASLPDNNEAEELEFRIVRRDGNTRWIHHVCRPVLATGSDNRGRRVSNRDITEQKHQLEERRQLEQQMMHTQKLESLGVMAGGIAHDFNNILTSIVGNADIAMMRIPPESIVAENLKKIEQGALRATDLAKQLLAYSGKGRFIVEPLDLNRMIEDMVHLLQVSISKKALLRFHFSDNLPSIEGDATQLRQIIMNIVINASDAIGEKSGVIAIRTGCIECDRKYLKGVWMEENIAEGMYVYLEISDTGCGMDKETVSKIFDPFFTTKFTGRGLGMAAVLGIVRGHRGAIKVYSEPGKGTTFKVLLPAGALPASIFNAVPDEMDWKGEGTVLLVDDEDTVCAIGSEMLQMLGFDVVTASDGREALAKYKEIKGIRCVILDLTMPHMDGDQAFRELRTLDPEVKVVMSSGYNEHEINQKFAGKGLAGFIQKPYRLSTLKEVMQKALAE
ncbi:blue-light-activated protein [Geobacter sp. OR-1]|uniref:ATP-binding response regulator n=1 Tax=Geobacter sp. OR-1 TaxID=1266765 RepID=UPI00054337B3|nr:response regulator [Geobacter sp. OR-1]GAM07770.1 blue-light-activated protein [Geobacter sp. OR-1]